ncbi:MAG: stage II sporulation protein M [Cyanobacteria bacterium J06621_15]
MNIQRWIAKREPNWQRLDSLLRQIEQKGVNSLETKEIGELRNLYRLLKADLIRARTQNLSNSLIINLQTLKNRAYKQINIDIDISKNSRRKEYWGIIKFYRWGLPAILQQTFPYIALATALFLLAVLVASLYSWQDPNFMPLIVPSRIISKVRDDGQLWMSSLAGIEQAACSEIIINNLRVSLSAVVGGISAGIFTVYIIVFNGLLIGTVATLVAKNNLAYSFWAFVFPHGSLELPAILIAGGAGLLIAKAIILPGKYRRLNTIKRHTFQAIQLLLGIVPMLIIAGIIETFFSSNPNIPNPIKYLTGISLFLLLIIYFRQKSINSEQ